MCSAATARRSCAIMLHIWAASSVASSRRSRRAGHPRSAVMSRSVATAGWCATPTIPAATGTVRSAKAWHVRSGSRRVRPSCCRCPTTTWSSHCPRRRPKSRSKTSASSMPSCSAPPPTRCATSPLTRGTSAPRSGRSPCCTRGARPCTTTRICTALSRAAACRRIRQVGSPVGQDSSCLCASSRGGSAGCSSDGYKRPLRLANCASPVRSRL